MFHARSPRRWTAIAVLAVALAGGCTGSGPGGETETDPTGTPAPAAAREVSADGDGSAPSGAVDPEGMVVAADLLVTGGDVDRAIADGLVTEADVAAARRGLDAGTLDHLFD